MNISIEKIQVEAKTHKLRSRWLLEVAQDLKAMHDLNNDFVDFYRKCLSIKCDAFVFKVLKDTLPDELFKMELK